MSGRDRLVERQILKAQAEGKMTGLVGEGQPLADHPEQAFVSPADAVGFRIMAEAGVLPDEIRLRKEADALREAWQAETDETRRKHLMAALAEVEMKRAIAEDARRKFLR